MRLLLAGLVLGIISASTFSISYYAALVSGCIGCVFCVRSLLCACAPHIWKSAGYVAFATALGISLLNYHHETYVLLQKEIMQCKSPCAFEGMIVSHTRTTDESQVYEVKLQKIGASDVQSIYVAAQAPLTTHLFYGDTLSFTGSAELFHPFLSDTGRLVPYDALMRARGVHARIDIEHMEQHESVQSLLRVSARSTDTLQNALGIVLPEPAAGLGKGIVFGASGTLDKETEDMFRATGLSHITVFSGSNVALVLALVWFMTARFPYTLRVICSIGALILVLCGVGLSPPALRAGLMGGLFVVARAAGKSSLGIDVLFLSVLCMLLMQPDLLMYDVSFQLSALAVLALMTIAQPLEDIMRGYVPSWSVSLIAMTCAVLVVVSPWVAYVFGTFSISALPANIVIVPLVPFALCATLITSIVAVLSPALSVFVSVPTELLLRTILEIARLFASIPYSNATLPQFHGSVLFVWYAVIALWYIKAVRTR